MKGLVRVVIAFICILLIGCVSHEYSDQKRAANSPIPYDLKAGDNVQIVTSSGQKHEFKIEDISNTSVSGGGTTIQFNDMRIVRVKSVDVGKTILDTGELTLWVMNLLLLIGLIVLTGG